MKRFEEPKSGNPPTTDHQKNPSKNESNSLSQEAFAKNLLRFIAKKFSPKICSDFIKAIPFKINRNKKKLNLNVSLKLRLILTKFRVVFKKIILPV